MAIAVVVSSRFASGRVTRVIGTLTFTGNYVSGGDALPASAFGAGTTKKPIAFDVNGKAGYKYEYDNEAGKLKIFTAGQTELSAAAYPAGIATTDVVRFDATFPKFG